MDENKDSQKPVQPIETQKPGGSKPAARWRIPGVCAALGLLFASVFAAAWCLRPIRPYATLHVDQMGGSAVFSPDSTLLVTSGREDFGRTKGPLRVWDVAAGQERFTVAPNWKAIETVLLSPDSTLLAAHEENGNLNVWNTRTGQEVTSIKPVTYFNNWVSFCFSPDGRFLVYEDFSKGGPDQDYITFWNIESKQAQGSVKSYFWTLSFAPDGRSFATFRRKERHKINEVLLWKMDKVPVVMKRHHITASYVAFSPDLMTFAAADDLPDGNGEVIIWEMGSGKRRSSLTFNEHDTHLQKLSFMANGKILAAHGGGGTQLDWHWRTTLWDLTSTPKEVGSFSEMPAVSPDGQWLATPLDSGATLLKISAPDEGTDLVVNGDEGPSAFGSYNNMKVYPTPSFSPDRRMVIVKGLHRFAGEPFLGEWMPASINPFPAGPSGSVVRAWDVASRREIMAFSNCSDVWFSPDGRVMATLREGHAIDLWKLPLPNPVWRVFGWIVLVGVGFVSVCWLGVRTWKRLVSQRFLQGHP